MTVATQIRTALGLILFSAHLSAPLLSAQDKEQPDYINDYAQITALVSYFLQNQHFSRHPISVDVASEWIENYMLDLDPNRMIFLAGDHDEFVKSYARPITEAIANEIAVPAFSFFGSRAPIQASEKFGPMAVAPAYQMYEHFKKRVGDRVTWAQQRLDQPFDFDSEEYYAFDRSQAKWPANSKEADQLWEKRLKYEILQDQLSDIDSESDSKTHAGASNTPPPPIKPEDFKVAPATIEKINSRYDRILKYSLQTDHEDILEIYLSALTSTFDPHSQYLSQKTLEDFHIMMQQKLVGIGAVLAIDPRTGYCTIREIMPGGPADIDGRINVNDRIVSVAQGDGEFVDVYDMKLRDAVRLIRGNLGSTVRLEVIPADAKDTSARKTVELVRNEISVSMQKAKARHLILKPENGASEVRLGLIQLPSFYGDKDDGNSTTEDVHNLLKELKKEGIDGLVLDLRNNGGGLLNEAIQLTGLFIDEGPVVQVKNYNGAGSTYKDRDAEVEYDGPLIVLTNKLSASASEIVAGALQNYRRAIIIGDQSTHGKGTVQTVAALNEYLKLPEPKGEIAGAMKLTVQQFYLPDGTSTQGRGVVPDITLPSLNNYIDIGESSLPHSLPWDQIDAVEFSPLSNLPPTLLDVLSNRSRGRISNDEEFSLLHQDIEKLQSRMKDKRESLNLAQRLAEILEKEKTDELRDASLDRTTRNLPEILSITFNEERAIVREKETYVSADLTEENQDKLPYPTLYANDLHLRETMNVLHDWILIQQNKLPQESIALHKADSES